LSAARRSHRLEPWEVSIVASGASSVPHLIATSDLDTAREPQALCGAKATRRTRSSFRARGCLRCCKAALDAGLKIVVVGSDHQLVDLTEVRRSS
jgi:hypothetical protein